MPAHCMLVTRASRSATKQHGMQRADCRGAKDHRRSARDEQQAHTHTHCITTLIRPHPLRDRTATDTHTAVISSIPTVSPRSLASIRFVIGTEPAKRSPSPSRPSPHLEQQWQQHPYSILTTHCVHSQLLATHRHCRFTPLSRLVLP